MKAKLNAAFALLMIGGSIVVLAQSWTPASGRKSEPTTAQQVVASIKCQEMMLERANAKSKIKDMDVKLDDLMRAMDLASEQDKTVAMSAVVRELVIQRTLIRTMHDEAEEKMMAHMMGHSGAKKSDCPMMKLSH